MIPKLSDEQRQAIEQQGGQPVYVVDAETNTSYVLLRADQYQSFSALVTNEGFDVRELYPLIARSAAAAGWDDPAMDDYDDYDAHKRP